MGTAAAVVGATVVGGVLQHNANVRAGRAAGNAAQAQLAEERERRRLALEFAEFSPEELAQAERAIELNEKDIARKEELLASADPALIEAGKQALQLLQGEEAKTLDPIKRQRQEDRRKLEDKLRNQLGPGFATSTAGIQALNDFDAETGSLLAVEQDRSLGRLLGVAQNTANISNIGSNIDRAMNISQLFGNQRSRAISAINGTPITQAGAPFVGDVLKHQADAQLIGNLTGAATSGLVLSDILGGKGGGGGTVRALPFTGTFNQNNPFSGGTPA